MIAYLYTKTPLIFFTQNLWRDEAFSYLLAIEPINRIISLTAKDFNPPLYYIVLHYWISIFGSSEIAIRSLSLIMFGLLIYVIYIICDEIFHLSIFGTILMLILFFINPFLTYYAFEARTYMMVTFFIALSYYALWSNRKKLYIFSITLALYTHYLAILILIAQILPSLINWKLKFFQKKFSSRYIDVYAMLSSIKSASIFITPVVLFFPWLVYMFMVHDFSDSSFWIIRPPSFDLWYIPFVLYTAYERVFGEYYHGGPGYFVYHTRLLILLYAILFLPLIIKFQTLKRTIRQRHHRLAYYRDLLLWAFLPPALLFILALITNPLYLPRYFIFSAPGLVLLLGLLILSLFQNKSDWIHLLMGGILLVTLVTMTHEFNLLNLKYRSKRLIAPLINEIKTQMNEGDYLYVRSELDYHLVKYYMGDKMAQVKIYQKVYDQLPGFVGKVIIPREDVVSSLPIFPNKVFILSYNSYEIVSAY
ncbi:hypothetical protein A3A93_00080 [Candidatus Roizmanbacteria bacterium RIFCSPLOWO2_01_FULL_38_12]|uniref:Uncharacterized protein n=1 Tax=Candidatus Roizmanbacteria bacterium RIFCSPLOWO2_01_FULL_38_12 TaxID=1802061 RepID=A0A1F7J0L5_9BACT|nr:MAG: hypothetical protein A2861_04045 [Candidatus Roizmanbacteria bacterium RIFCSPHIGHO2_01_FULL_38_15]OGK34883.1 MAG: hypothetical protein A3F59_02710 [Candidatus Roizmanbacteria bacterium RIFCSPHIGHO2_12_FULL_38_13]OGK49149.1 MAG: hypothetical protein A3A93_00080 [Candidatus Roizmanbacteria bacterium RIFCSPLOWO2_01_FULL_38_12]